MADKILPFKDSPRLLEPYDPPMIFYSPSIASMLWSTLSAWNKPALQCADEDQAQAIVDGVKGGSVAIMDMYRG